jgi:hypothetical protein
MTGRAGGSADGTPPPKRRPGDVSSVAVVTALLALFGWLAGRGALPWFRCGGGSLAGAFSARGRTFLGAWLCTLTGFTLVLPLTSAFVWRRHEGVRRTMAPYALVLLVQIATEAALSRLFFPNIVAIVGLPTPLIVCGNSGELGRYSGSPAPRRGQTVASFARRYPSGSSSGRPTSSSYSWVPRRR